MSLVQQSPLVIQWWRAGVFVRNLSAVCALVALGFTWVDWMRPSSPVPLRRKLSLGMSGFAFLAVFSSSLVLAGEYTSVRFVVLAAGASYMWCALCFGSAARHAATWPPRVAAVAGYVGSVLAVLVLILSFAQNQGDSFEATGRVTGWLGRSAEVVGEGLYLLVTVLLAWMAWSASPGDEQDRAACGWRVWRGWRGWARVLLVVGGTAGAVVSMWLGRKALGFDFAILVYGAHRLQWAAFSSWALIYAIIFGCALGAGAGAWLLADGRGARLRTAQLWGVAVLAWVSAGYAPRVPVRLLMMALGAACAARAMMASCPSSCPPSYPPSHRSSHPSSHRSTGTTEAG
jgi:hypothetical protein